jgi:hypothetical protein
MTSISDTIDKRILRELSNVYTATPGRIESYNPRMRKASVKPMIRKKFNNGEILELPVVDNVPVQFPMGTDAGLRFPLKRNDTCLLVFGMRSLDEWLTRGGIITPDDSRKFDLSDAICIPGLFPFSKLQLQNNDDCYLFNDSGKIVINDDGKIALGNDKAELLEIIDKLLDALTSAICVPGGSLSTVAQITAEKVKLQLIKGEL